MKDADQLTALDLYLIILDTATDSNLIQTKPSSHDEYVNLYSAICVCIPKPAAKSKMVALLNYWVVGEADAGCIIIEKWTTVALLKDAIKAKHPIGIQCDAADLQLFLAKTTEGSWQTVNGVVSGVSDTSGMIKLKIGSVPLRAYGLSEKDMQVEVSDAELVAGNGPVHVLVKMPQQPQPTLTQPLAVETPSSLNSYKLEQAVTQLCAAHKSTFIGANFNYRDDAWPIALADNEKSEFGRQYIQRWPEAVLAPQGFQSSLCACRTIVVDIDHALFVDALDGKATLLEVALDEIMNTALARAVIAQLEVPDELPDYLSTPNSVNG